MCSGSVKASGEQPTSAVCSRTLCGIRDGLRIVGYCHGRCQVQLWAWAGPKQAPSPAQGRATARKCAAGLGKVEDQAGLAVFCRGAPAHTESVGTSGSCRPSGSFQVRPSIHRHCVDAEWRPFRNRSAGKSSRSGLMESRPPYACCDKHVHVTVGTTALVALAPCCTPPR